MSTPNPLLPQGSLQGQAKGKSNFRIAVLTILGIHVVVIFGFLMFGCKPETPKQDDTTTIEPAAQTSETFEPFGSTDTANPFPNDLPPYSSEPAVTSTGAIDTPIDTGTVQAPIADTPIPTNVYQPAVPTDSVQPVTPATPTTPNLSVPAGESTVHQVAAGETISSIAPKYGVTVRAILDANPDVNPNRLQIGQKLNIPARSTSASSTAVTTSSSPSTNGGTEYVVYTVKSGDVLERIARNHGTTVNAIKSANGLRTDRINVGQKLKIPKKANGQ